MSTEEDKLSQISEKISELIALKNQTKEDLEQLKIENKTLKEERFTLANQNSILEKEVEKLKAIDGNVLPVKNKLDEAKINGMIKEIEECLTLLKS